MLCYTFHYQKIYSLGERERVSFARTLGSSRKEMERDIERNVIRRENEMRETAREGNEMVKQREREREREREWRERQVSLP